MIFKTHMNKGFVTTVTVLVLCCGALALSLSVLVSAVWYSDAIRSREIRIQNGLNREACMETVKIMIQKNFFLNGEVELSRFGCKVFILNDFDGNALIEITSVRLN